MALPTLPSTLTVLLSGQPLEVFGKPNKDQTRIWFEHSGLVPEEMLADDGTTDFESVVKSLTAITVSYSGSPLTVGEVHVSEPSKYRKGHAKAGQIVPGTGGNWTVTHSASIELKDSDGKSHGYTLMVTVTYLEGKGFKVYAKALGQNTAKILDGITFAFAQA